MVIGDEDSATTAHLVLPPSPALTEAEMAMIAGGGNCNYHGCNLDPW